MPDPQRNIVQRKSQHLDICIDADRYDVEGGCTRFDDVRFFHDALPELNAATVTAGTEWLGHRLSLPVFISSMTGGSEKGFQANRELAKAAQHEKIGVGLGSIRILFHNSAVLQHFMLRTTAPDIPIFANLGGVQIRDMPHDRIFEMLKRLEVSAFAIHLNPGQELFQQHGDRDFRGVLDGIARFCEHCPVPVIVKETGFGVSLPRARQLIDAGAAYVDLAGAGGTNWISVEAYRESPAVAAAAEEFRRWGMPTALLLAAADELHPHLLASGGLRSGMDAAKAIALGARLAGFALPCIRAVHRDGSEGVQRFIDHLRRVFTAVMAMTGSSSLSELRRGIVWYSSDFQNELDSFRRMTYGE